MYIYYIDFIYLKKDVYLNIFTKIFKSQYFL